MSNGIAVVFGKIKILPGKRRKSDTIGNLPLKKSPVLAGDFLCRHSSLLKSNFY
jgi:hypothetical protein